MTAALLAAASGLALALALPGAGWAPLVLVFPGLFLAAVGRTGTWRRAAMAGWLGGTVHWLAGTHWVVEVMDHYGGLPLWAALACLLGMSALLGLTWAVTAAVVRAVGAPLRPWIFAFSWTALEVVRELPVYRFPWNTTASVLAPWPGLLQSLPVWGATGLGWALAAVGAGGWALLSRSTRASGVALLASSIILATTLSFLAPGPGQPSGPVLRVAALQPGTTLEEKWDPSQAADLARRVVEQTREAAEEGAVIVLWPESAVPFNLEADRRYRHFVEELAEELEVTIVLNSIGASPRGGYTNSAYVVTPGGLSPHRYDKIRLVPFGEYVPVVGRLAFARPLVREVGRFTPGTDPRPLEAGGIRLGLAICFEIVFPSLVVREVREGAEILVTLTNDGWYGRSWAPHQHFAQAVLRAVETRRWVARAALTGISGFVDPTGRVVRRLPVGNSGVLVADLVPLDTLTPRVRLGDWWAWVSALATAGILVRHRRRNHHPRPVDLHGQVP